MRVRGYREDIEMKRYNDAKPEVDSVSVGESVCSKDVHGWSAREGSGERV